ncbi:MAG: FAD-dependent oxidoreductase [Lachnospiraceae bacterium]|nr:FAD-dependent oxidoreductase [Lachnospiraceae bacterium]
MFDVVIVGSGPAGLGAAIYAKRAMLDAVVIEKAGYSGGQIINTDDVDNYLGLSGISGYDMAMSFREHADKLDVLFKDVEVTNIAEETGGYRLSTSGGDDILTKTVILATGANHSKLNVTGEDKYTGKGVSYCATCDGAFYRGKEVAVIGGGDVALEDALYLSKIASKVYLVHRRDELRGAKSLQDKVFAADNIEFVKDTVVEAINGEIKVTDIDVLNVKSKEACKIKVDGVFIAVGMKPNTEFVNGFVDMDEKGYIKALEDGITSRAGIFVAGDARTKNLRQVITAVADGANCVASVEKYLNLL